jgi:cytochrome c2
MPILQVAGGPTYGGSTAAPNDGIRIPDVPTALLGLFSLLALAAGVFFIARSRGQQRYQLIGAGLIVLCGGLAFAFLSSANAPARPVPVTSMVSAGASTGQQLFLAKGCVVCHVNARALDTPEEYSVSIGPNLSAYHNDPAYLHKFLANPKGTIPTTIMPNLGLSPAEIDALVSFINESK